MPTVMQWTKRLVDKIDAQQKYSAPFQKRYDNEHVLPFLRKEYAEVYPGVVMASADGRTVDTLLSASGRAVLEPPRSGTAGIVIDALTERLMLSGLSAADDAAAARVLEQAWEDNDLDVMHPEAHREAMIGARSFASIDRAVGASSQAVVGIESHEQAAVHRSQGPPYDVDAYLKVWVDEWTGKRIGLLRLAGFDIDLVELDAPIPDPQGSGEHSRWAAAEPRATGLTGVPVVEFAPRARLLKEPVSELDPISSLIDVVDLVEGLLVFAGHFGAVPIRYATGLDIPRDQKDPTKPLLGPDGKPMVGFKPRADHFWSSTNKDAKFGQLEPAGLASFVTWAEHASAKVRAKTALASTYFSLDLKSHMSAELLKTDEAPMVRRMNRMGPEGSLNQSWRRVGRWILAIESPSTRTRVRPRWQDPETRIESQLVDQFVKLTASGLGVRTTAKEVLGWDSELVDAAVDEYEKRQDELTGGDAFALLDAGTRANLKLLPGGNTDTGAGA